MREAHYQQLLTWRVENLFVGSGLSQADYSIGGGRFVHIPHVVSVVTDPTVGLDIRMLPGQTPDDFTAQATAIAYNLGVAEVRVIRSGPP
jgi:hypothetical protein